MAQYRHDVKTDDLSVVLSIFAGAVLASCATTTTAATTTPCTVTAFSAVASATASCTAITLENVAVPGGETLDLSKLKTGTTVTFAGTTTFGYYDWDSDLIDVGGTNITITAAAGAVIDGNGQSWWDGQGSNGGIAKYFLAHESLLMFIC